MTFLVFILSTNSLDLEEEDKAKLESTVQENHRMWTHLIHYLDGMMMAAVCFLYTKELIYFSVKLKT